MKRPSLALLLILSLAACDKSEDTAKKAEDTAATATQDKKKKTKREPVDEGIDVPTEEDFEETAAAQITEQSDLSKELDQLEKDIGK